MRKVILGVLFCTCFVLLATAQATEWVQGASATSSIRSAQLFAREGGWQSVAARSAGDERAEIRAHFAAVNRVLLDNEPGASPSLCARFERAYDLALTRAQRTELLYLLAARRAVQLGRLTEYADAGGFPLNRHYVGEARPIFVDANGTHCAVGHLMARDGWEPEVIAIARATPNVLVREISGGPLVSWVLTSGLIEEEAALDPAPAYYPAPVSGATKLSDLVVPGASLDRDGFRYENFGFSAAGSGARGSADDRAVRLLLRLAADRDRRRLLPGFRKLRSEPRNLLDQLHRLAHELWLPGYRARPVGQLHDRLRRSCTVGRAGHRRCGNLLRFPLWRVPAGIPRRGFDFRHRRGWRRLRIARAAADQRYRGLQVPGRCERSLRHAGRSGAHPARHPDRRRGGIPRARSTR